MSDILDLMNPEVIARLRHELRTPLNQLIGYADIARRTARQQGAHDEVRLMEQVLNGARQMVEQVQEALPAKAHIAEDAIPGLRIALKAWLQYVDKSLTAFDEQTGGACAAEMRQMRSAMGELRIFARAADHEPVVPIPLPPVNETPRSGGRAESRAASRGSGGSRILVVDDNDADRDSLLSLLEEEGYDAAGEPDGPAALARLEREPFGLVLLDIQMPRMDGFQVLAEMKRRVELQDIPVIVLAAHEDQSRVVRSMELGAEDFIAKPVDSAILGARAGAILRRSRAEAERAEMADSLQLLLETTGDGFFGQDKQGRCVFVNRAALEMLRCTRQDLLGRNMHEVIHHTRSDGTAYPAENCPFRAVIETGEPRRGRDEMLIRADGSTFPIEYSAHPIRRAGRADGVMVTFTDLSRRASADESQPRSSRLESLGVAAGGIAHDFNNILTGIIGNTSLVLESLPESDPNGGLLAEVIDAGQRAANLSRQLLAFAGKGQSDVERVDVSKAIHEIGDLLAAALPKPAKLKLALALQLTPVEADRRQIQQLILNLVIDAGERLGERGGLVTLQTGMRELPEGAPAEPGFGPLSAGRYIWASVQYAGPGMDEQTRAGIFDSSKFAAGAAAIARSHHGAIRVESTPGRGSRFEVLLPAKQTRVFHMPPAAEIEAPHSTRLILVVDDEALVRATSRKALERRGYKVLLAETGQQAIETFRRRAPEIALVLLDLTLPVMSGEEAARQLLAIRPGVPIVITSGYPDSEVARRFSSVGVTGFLRKPYTAAALTDRIAAVIG